MSFPQNPPNILSQKTSSQILDRPTMSFLDPFSFNLNQPNNTSNTKIKVYSRLEIFFSLQLQIRDVQNCHRKRDPCAAHCIQQDYSLNLALRVCQVVEIRGDGKQEKKNKMKNAVFYYLVEKRKQERQKNKGESFPSRTHFFYPPKFGGK